MNIKRINAVAKIAQSIVDDPDLDWEEKYDQIFGGISTLLIKMNFHFHYYDPDMDYEDDVRAYNDALQFVVKERLEQHFKDYQESFNL